KLINNLTNKNQSKMEFLMYKTKGFMPKNFKSQAAMEFLMTYGWALLVVLIAIAALAFFGLLNPSRFLPEKADLGTGLIVQDAFVKDDFIALLVYNGLGETLHEFTVTVDGCEGQQKTNNPFTFTSGSIEMIGVDCKLPASPNSRLRSEMTASYKTRIAGHELQHSRKGEINWNVADFTCGDEVYLIYRGNVEIYGSMPSPNTGECWMDRNLGATRVAESPTDHEAYGDFFQWGRLDDGHQVIEWTGHNSGTPVSGTTSSLSDSDNPDHSDFITNTLSPYDWRVPQEDNLWQGVDGINNPCPQGWRLPTTGEWDTEIANWELPYDDAAHDSLRLTLSSLRYYSDGALVDVGVDGYYWTSSVAGSDASGLYFDDDNVDTINVSRAFGFSVRCIRN
ncbi:MAG: hypothetical protein ACMXX5_01855, partial [Candidatus Woesearchaeota archaeon]